ncbi:MAG: hypothetical protein ACRC8S_06835 [Fimbriiglobus sp.]
MKKLLWALFFSWGSLVASAADPAAPLLPLVPEDAAIVFVVRNAQQQLERLAESPMMESFLKSHTGQLLKGHFDPSEAKKAAELFASQLGVTPEELRNDILGNAIVFYYQFPKGTQSDAGTLLIRPNKPEVMQRLLDRINALQVAAKEIEPPKKVDFASSHYMLRTKADGTKEFYRLADGYFVFSNRESTIQDIIKATATPAKELPKWLTVGGDRATITALFQPRAFDTSWQEKLAASTNRGEKAMFGQIQKLWSAFDGVAVSLHAEKTLTLTATVEVNESRLPTEWKTLTARGSTHTLPEQAMIAFRGPIHLKTWIEVAAPFFPEGDLKKFVNDIIGPAVGKDHLAKVLDQLGPNWSFWISSNDKPLPEIVWFCDLPTELVAPVQAGIDSLFHMIRLEHNRREKSQLQFSTLTTTSIAQPRTTVSRLTHPEGFQLNSTIHHSNKTLAIHTSGQLHTQMTSAPDGVVLRVNSGPLRRYLSMNEKAIAGFLARQDNRPIEEVRKDLESISSLLEFVNKFEISLGDKPSRWEIRAELEFTKPLQK